MDRSAHNERSARCESGQDELRKSRMGLGRMHQDSIVGIGRQHRVSGSGRGSSERHIRMHGKQQNAKHSADSIPPSKVV